MLGLASAMQSFGASDRSAIRGVPPRPHGCQRGPGSRPLPEWLGANHANALQVAVFVGVETEQVEIDPVVVLAEAGRWRAGLARRRREPPGRGNDAIRPAE